MKLTPVLFVNKNSIYKSIGCVDCWDEERNALSWPGGSPAIYHPPCRKFCRMAHLSSAPESEKKLAYWSVDNVRQFGGVLEHPSHSKLWIEKSLPLPNNRDEWGFTIQVSQFWWGNLLEKKTWLYVCGARLKDVPPMPFCKYEPEYTMTGGASVKRGYKKELTKHLKRSDTSLKFALWLLDLCSHCKSHRESVHH